MPSVVKYRYKIFFLALVCSAIIPLSGYAINDPNKKECSKKKNSQKDSLVVKDVESPVLLEETKIPVAKTAIKQTTSIRTTHKTFEDRLEESNGLDEDPNSAMSFNFIYYIIDKFKFTDPLE